MMAAAVAVALLTTAGRAESPPTPALGITGTPAFVVGDTLIPGAVDSARLQASVADARAGS